MASLTNAKSKRMYSWWWDSHISPKNSKWLQENLTDMDVKVKQMIKLIEEDADSFARRAEMYYKKRPELMRMVEDFYRAYRALAERYDNATGLIRQAHRTMIEVFPNQAPGEDVPAMVDDPDDLQKDSSFFYNVKKNKSGDRQTRRSLNFLDDGEKEHEKEIVNLKESLAKLEAEKVAGLFQYQRSLENLSELEKHVARAQEDSKRHNERASKAEAEALALAADLTQSKSEREACMIQYQQCMDKIASLEKNLELAQGHNVDLNERVHKAETEAEATKLDLSIMVVEKEEFLAQNNELLLKIANLESKLLQAEDNIRKFSAQADKAESQVASLKQAISELTNEKEAASRQYLQCLETISILESQLSRAHGDSERLHEELCNGISKLKGAEDQCLQLNTSNQSLSKELADLMHKMATHDEELTQKQQELGTLLACIQEERVRFKDVESSFKNLQHLHTQSQEELKSLNDELQQRTQVLTELQTRNDDLQAEVYKAKEANLSYTMSTKNMQDELTSLRADREKLEQEVKLRVEERNALQEDIGRLKEEINILNSKHDVVIERVSSVGLNVESFGSAVKELQIKNSKLQEDCEKEKSEKAGYLEKLVIMEQLLEKNAALESSISGLREELQASRAKVRQLEELIQFYLGEKSVLIAEKLTIFSQLQITTENLGKLSEKNAVLENSLAHANEELSGFRENTKRLEESCRQLNTDKSLLITENESLSSQLQISQQKLEDVRKKYSEMAETCLCLEKEKDVTLDEVEKLKNAIEVEKREHAESAGLNATHLNTLESELYSLQERFQNKEKELQEKVEEAVNAQIEIFILESYVKDLEDEKLEQRAKVNSSLDQIDKMRTWMYCVLKALGMDLVAPAGSDDMIELDQAHADSILCKIQGTESSLSKSMDDNQLLILENSVLGTLLEQMGLMSKNLEIEKNVHYQELVTRTRESLALQKKNELLENEIHGTSNEVISFNFLSLIYKRALIEAYAEMRTLCENLDQVRAVCGVMEAKVKVMVEKLELSGAENQRLEALLHRKDAECLEAEKKLYVLQNEAIAMKENHEKQIQILKTKFLTLEEAHVESKATEKTLRSQLEHWEIEGATVFTELQVSAVYGAVLAEKVHELADTCIALEDKSSHDSAETEVLKERVGTLENKNERLEAHLAASIPAISSLDRSIASLENLITKRDHEREVQDDNLDRHLNPSSSGDLVEDLNESLSENVPDLQCLETRVKAIEKALIETERLAFRKKANHARETEANTGAYSNRRSRTHEISEAGSEILTKDIVLDQVSDCSPYNISKRETNGSDDKMLELWETNYRNGSIDLKVGKSPKTAAPAEPTLYHEMKAVRRQSSSRHPSSEKDLSFDKFEISRRFSETRQEGGGGNKKTILDRLASDAQKLTNLQITVHDLKKMVEMTEKHKKGKGSIEFSNVKEQLEESEDAILKLFDIIQTLVSKAEEKSANDTDESSYIRKRRVSDQARKGSEKIGRLQLEVQKLQFLLLKLDGEKEKTKANKRASERRRVLLRDYLYGAMRPSQRKKKASFCACVRSPTKDD